MSQVFIKPSIRLEPRTYFPVSFAPSSTVTVGSYLPKASPMNALPPAERQALELVDIIEFKWLMAGAGVRVHVERLQADPEYARACLAQAAASPEAAVREAALKLVQLMTSKADGNGSSSAS